MYLRYSFERRRADRAQFAAGQLRLEHIRSIHRAFGRARADDGVQLVDEENDLALRASVTSLRNAFSRSSNSPRNFAPATIAPMSIAISRLVLQRLRHVAGNDAAREPFHDRGFAHAGLADENRIVFRPAREHLHDAADFVVAADHRIDLPAARALGQVAGRISPASDIFLPDSGRSRAANRAPAGAPASACRA